MSLIFSCMSALAMGFVAGSAASAFFIVLGIFSKLSAAGGLPGLQRAYAGAAALGVLWGCFASLFGLSLHAGMIFADAASFFSGAYIGVFIISLAEVINLLPLLYKSQRRKAILILMLLILVASKVAGSLLDFLGPVFK
jgi:stage V sporulation protein AB